MFQPARGTRDYLPEEMLKRDWVQDRIRSIFEAYGYQPLGTPAFENWDMLKIKSGEEVINQIYYFRDKSERELGLRFEWTASLARVVSNHRELPKPFKRYAVGPVWRYERPSEMSRREFWQMDVDIVGVEDPIADTEVLTVAVDCLKNIGFEGFIIRINDRRLLEALVRETGLPMDRYLDIFRAVDKRSKIGDGGVIEELGKLGATTEASEKLLEMTSMKGDPTKTLDKTMGILRNQPEGLEACRVLNRIVELSEAFGIRQYLIVDLSLARGLDYYTGPVFEVYAEGYEEAGSIAGGGRYDDLVELFGGDPTPMTGISMGIDRLVPLLDQIGVFGRLTLGPEVYVAATSENVRQETIEVAQRLRRAGFKTDLNIVDRGLRTQLDNANKRGFSKVVIVGERELKEGCVAVKDMETSEQRKVRLEDIVEAI
ncbi:MAG: histidine--tRNA ligase [Candidatus Bathyarchaeota archaeon]|jgi:histidyl-tRNA synthetase